MAHIQIRPATQADLPALMEMDHGYSTESVWQMDHREDNGQIQIVFRPVRLPRPMRVTFPRDPQRLQAEWQDAPRGCFLVASEDEQLKGYINVSLALAPHTGWITDYVVERRFRRMGVGRVLLTAAIHWAQTNQLQRLILETHSKNYPAICFAQKQGLVFCGYNDRYYPNQDVALFFGMALK
jgi:ribosomal protein S18 acetylase RimI-like enzyme